MDGCDEPLVGSRIFDRVPGKYVPREKVETLVFLAPNNVHWLTE